MIHGDKGLAARVGPSVLIDTSMAFGTLGVCRVMSKFLVWGC